VHARRKVFGEGFDLLAGARAKPMPARSGEDEFPAFLIFFLQAKRD
jgi:hypothetical protein